jgi:predicted transcriptional regulator
MKNAGPQRFTKRSRVDIIACILRNSNNGSRKTRLIYRCNLSLSQFNMYTNCIIEGGLLEDIITEEGVEIYHTTEKGREFLNDYDSIKKVLDKMRI